MRSPHALRKLSSPPDPTGDFRIHETGKQEKPRYWRVEAVVVSVRQEAAQSLQTELDADAVLIIDYIDAFGTKTVRTISGTSPIAIGSEVWLPDWLTPVDVDMPVKLADTDTARLSKAGARRKDPRLGDFDAHV